MKIIKEGVIPDGFMPIRFECIMCHCVFEATNDEYELDMHLYGDGYRQYASIKCPYCGHETYQFTGKEKKYENRKGRRNV